MIESGLTDDELTELALAADPDQPLADDAVALPAPGATADLLPGWYMPAAVAPARSRRRRIVLGLVVVALVLVNAAGLCVTYGTLEIAW